MPNDRYLKAVLTVIAIALSVIAMALVEVAPTASATASEEFATLAERNAEVVAGEGEGVRQEQRLREEPSSGVAPRAPTSTLPLRWRIGAAVATTTASTTFCTTAIDVTNATDSTVSVEVEWHDDLVGSLELVSSSVDAFAQHTFVANDSVSHLPWLGVVGLGADLSNFDGYALVSADDPRIFVHAAIICRDGLGSTANMVALYASPVFPVGATAAYFQASAPGGIGIPPMDAVPEPES